MVEVDGHVLLGIGGDDPVVDELADTAAGDHLVAVALEDIGFLDHLAVGVVPAGPGRVVPGEQTHAPGELEHARGGQLDVVAPAHTQLGLAARATRTPCGDLPGGDHDDHVLQGGVDRAPAGSGRLGRHHRSRKGLDGGGSVRPLLVLSGLGRARHGPLAQGDQVDVVAQAPGQVGRHRGSGGPSAHVSGAQGHQLGSDPPGVPGSHAGRLDGLHQRVVAAHQSGAAHPADARVGQCDALGPGGFGAPAVDDRVQGRLNFAVGTVAAENTAVGRTGQNHVEPVVDVRVGADGAQCRDGALHTPQ